MTSRCLRRLHLGLCGLLLAALSACAGLTPTPPAAALLDDAVFGHPTRPAEADGVMALDESMHRFLRERLADAVRDKGRPRALAEALYARGELKLDYDNTLTRNAAQAFAARSGNCLSLALMTAAMAHELGVDVRYQDVSRVESYSRSGGLTLQAGHINLVLAPRDARWRPESLRHEAAGDAVQIDFLPPPQLRGLRSEPISEQRVLAMFMNNRAVEALQHGAGPAVAYAWVREALRLNAGFWPAISAISAAAASTSFLSCVASPTPMLMTILSILGTCIRFL